VIAVAQRAMPVSVFHWNQIFNRLPNQFAGVIFEQRLGMIVRQPNNSFAIRDDRGISRRMQNLADNIGRQWNFVHQVF
jgi:hypothetical protein